MNASILLIPFFFIRFFLLNQSGKNASQRAAHFAPLHGNERIAYFIYQLTTLALIVVPFLLTIEVHGVVSVLGWILYALSLIILYFAIVHFAKPGDGGINTNGIYQYSRNPMYGAYFIFFLSCAILTQSWVYLGILVLFQIATHWIILAEERWCQATFEDAYTMYASKVRRYL